MTADQFLSQLQRQGPAPAYLFLGPDTFHRERCQRALIERVLPPEAREDGLTRLDLDDVSLTEALDDARALSLFARDRVLLVKSAESALPRARAGGSDRDEGGEPDGAAALAAYLRDPNPQVTLVFVAARYDFKGEDKRKQDNVRKFYAAVPHVVEFAHPTAQQARDLALSLAQERGLRLGEAEVVVLVEAVAADAQRIAIEVEKLSLHAGPGGRATLADLAALVPNARAASVFQLVAAIGRGDRQSALGLLDTLVREGEYLPLALSFLATQFRQALAAQEAGLRTAAQVQSFFSKPGNQMYRDRAEQVAQTMNGFSRAQLRRAIQRVYQADKDLRDTRPDDRVVLEEFVMAVTR